MTFLFRSSSVSCLDHCNHFEFISLFWLCISLLILVRFLPWHSHGAHQRSLDWLYITIRTRILHFQTFGFLDSTIRCSFFLFLFGLKNEEKPMEKPMEHRYAVEEREREF